MLVEISTIYYSIAGILDYTKENRKEKMTSVCSSRGTKHKPPRNHTNQETEEKGSAPALKPGKEDIEA